MSRLTKNELYGIIDEIFEDYGSSSAKFANSEREREKIFCIYKELFNSDFESDMDLAKKILSNAPYREREILLSIQGPHCGLERLPVYLAILSNLLNWKAI